MPAFPDRHEQIRLVHAEFIRHVAETCRNPERRQDFDSLLTTAEQNGWSELVGALRRIADGEQGPQVFAGLDEEDQIIADIPPGHVVARVDTLSMDAWIRTTLNEEGMHRTGEIGSTIRAAPSTMSRNCLGRSLRDSGQKRVPLPPAMITAQALESTITAS